LLTTTVNPLLLLFFRTSRFLRLAAAGATVAIPLLGAVTAQGDPSLGRVGSIAAVGFAYHVFAFVLNDVCDLPIDRTEPRRAGSPLVLGLVTPRFALVVAVCAGVAALALSELLGASPLAQALLLSSFVPIAAYDVWGKQTPVPPVIDVVQGVGWGMLAWYGAEMAGGAGATTAVFCVFLVGYIALANGVHGGVRDLGNDQARGAKTTPTFFGAIPLGGGAAKCSPTLRRYAITLETLNGILAGLMIPTLGYRGWVLGCVVAIWLLLFGLSRRLLHRALDVTEERRRMMVAGTSHLIVSFAAAVAVLLPVAPPVIAVFVLVVYVSPLLTYGWLLDAILMVPEPRSTR